MVRQQIPGERPARRRWSHYLELFALCIVLAIGAMLGASAFEPGCAGCYEYCLKRHDDCKWQLYDREHTAVHR